MNFEGIEEQDKNTHGFIKSALENNENVNSRTYELNKLKRSFPQYFDKEGNFNFDKFKSALDEKNVQYSDEEFSQKESYSLNFVGKKFAQILTGQEAVTVITPDLEHNNKPENKDSENIYIKGDNLEALKHMLNSYEGKIKCIYIDPPYNTGSDDFAYPDNFRYDKKTLIKMGLSEEEAERVENIYGKSTHSAWLTFMMPRLTLARDLLSDDGVIFISIDDNEQANLKALCDEIFGEENFVATFIIDKTAQGANQSITFKFQHEYCLLYQKQDPTKINYDIQKEINTTKFRYRDEKGLYAITNSFDSINSPLEKNKNRGYTIYYKDNENVIVKDEYDKQLNKFKEYDIKLINDGYTPIRPGIRNGVQYPWNWQISRFLEEYKTELVFQKNKLGNLSVYHKNRTNGCVKDTTLKKFDTRQDGNQYLINLMGMKVFNYPKSVEMIKWVLTKYKSEDFITLDFFSGSATTAHAVMQLNAEDSGNRKFILVNIQEPLKSDSEAYKASYRTICDIGIDRIKRASKKIKEETNADIDYGFKIYELNTPSNNTLDKVLSFDETVNKMYPEDLRENFKFNNINGEDTILQTWKVNDGYGFNAIHEEIELDSNIAYKVCKTLYLINPTTDDFIKSLIEKLDNELKDINKIVVFGYSYTLTQLQALDINIKNFNDIKGQDERVKVEVRY